ncbi:MAG: hypothetical protein QOJ16_3599 [Acidobacteriota bacterium]|nr:hypothetical protein [Acidobacteriota bacterium]
MKRAPLILALLLGLQPGAAPSQPPANPPERAAAEFGERIDVRAVDVEVVVVDAKGQRVHGLKAEDFKLLVDGQEERVDYFAEVAEGQAPPAPAVPETTPAAPVAAATAPAAPPSPPSVAAGGRVGTSYLVFVDEAFAVSSQRNAALSTLERDLALLGPGDRMAIVAYDGHGLTLLSPWTGDTAALRKAFAQAAKRPALGAHIVADRRGGQRADAIDVQDLYDDADLLGVNGFGLNQFWDQGKSASGVGRAATAAADALRGLPLPSGRRVMMVLAGGWPWDGNPKALRPLTSAANLLGYTLYPVHVAGYDPLMEAADAEVAATGSPVEASHMSSPPILSFWERSSEATLLSLARATGGVAAFNRDHALRQVFLDTRSYYWLGISPVWKADGRAHGIRVEVRRPGLSARARAGFWDLSRDTTDALTAESVLSLGGDPARKRLTVTAAAPRGRDRTTIELPVTFEVPAEVLTRLAQVAKGYPVEGRLAIASLDAAGRRGSLPGQNLRVVLPEAPRPGVVLRFHSVLQLRRAPQRLVFMVTGAEGAPIWTDLEFKP